MSHRQIHLRHERIDAYYSPTLGNTRPVELLLPPARYGLPRAVLYLNDGQDLLHLQVAEALSHLYAAQQIPPVAVVGVYATNQRILEYGVAGQPDSQGRGALAADYSTFFCQELLPELARRYHLPTAREHVAIAGLSLGGLMAFDLAWNRPDLFSAVAVFSGSFWWRTADHSIAAKISSRIAHRMIQASKPAPSLRFWLQAGTADEASDRDGDGMIDSIQDTRDLIMALNSVGYRPGRDIIYHEIVGGRHEPTTWAPLIPELLTWLFAGK